MFLNERGGDGVPMEAKNYQMYEEESDGEILLPHPIDQDIEKDLNDIWTRFEKEFLEKPGEHLIGIGITGSGKTQKAYWLARKLLEHETVAWFDTGKSYGFGQFSEVAPLFTFGVPINIIIPAGMTLDVKEAPVPVQVLEAFRPGDIWDLIQPGKINIIMISRFFLDPDLYAKYTAQAFKELIIISQNKKERIKHLLPMSIFHDEFQDVAPGQTMALSQSHLHSSKMIAWNINKLRSIGVRICAFSQKWTFIYPNCRVAFSWILCCRGAYFEREDPDLAAFNSLYKRLDVWQGIMWFPRRLFKHRWRFKLYEGPKNLVISHSGILTNI